MLSHSLLTTISLICAFSYFFGQQLQKIIIHEIGVVSKQMNYFQASRHDSSHSKYIKFGEDKIEVFDSYNKIEEIKIEEINNLNDTLNGNDSTEANNFKSIIQYHIENKKSFFYKYFAKRNAVYLFTCKSEPSHIFFLKEDHKYKEKNNFVDQMIDIYTNIIDNDETDDNTLTIIMANILWNLMDHYTFLIFENCTIAYLGDEEKIFLHIKKNKLQEKIKDMPPLVLDHFSKAEVVVVSIGGNTIRVKFVSRSLLTYLKTIMDKSIFQGLHILNLFSLGSSPKNILGDIQRKIDEKDVITTKIEAKIDDNEMFDRLKSALKNGDYQIISELTE